MNVVVGEEREIREDVSVVFFFVCMHMYAFVHNTSYRKH